MRARMALAVLAAILPAPVAASAAVTSNPNAYGATMQYLTASSSSCLSVQPPGQIPAQPPVPGGSCTTLLPFTVVMHVIAQGRYWIDIANTGPTGNFRYFAWILADGMTLRRIVSTRGGSCGPSSGMISCTRKLAARGCGCAQRDLIVDFTASGREPTLAKGGYWIHYGLVTPYLDVPSTFNDLTICTPGEKSTNAHPCLK